MSSKLQPTGRWSLGQRGFGKPCPPLSPVRTGVTNCHRDPEQGVNSHRYRYSMDCRVRSALPPPKRPGQPPALPRAACMHVPQPAYTTTVPLRGTGTAPRLWCADPPVPVRRSAACRGCGLDSRPLFQHPNINFHAQTTVGIMYSMQRITCTENTACAR